MALPIHADFLPLVDVMLAHWELADGAAGPGGITVLGGVDRGQLGVWRGELAAVWVELVHHENSVEYGAELLRRLRVGALERMVQFNEVARLWWGGTDLGEAVPRAPSVTAALEKYLRPMRDALRLWERMDAGVAPTGVSLPLKLGAAGDFGRVEMAGLVAEVLVARDLVEEGEFDLKLARARRDALEQRMWDTMVAYGRAVVARLGSGSNAAVTLPRLTPLPGHTPEPVGITGAWDEERGAARLEWEASGEESVESYSLRCCRGDVYDKKRERVVRAVPGNAERVAWVTEGLAGPGSVACFKVYVVLKTGNEKGSGAVVVRR